MKRCGTNLSRRRVVGRLAAATVLGAASPLPSREGVRTRVAARCKEPLLAYLREVVLRTPESIDNLLLGGSADYIPRRYDSELGYVFANGHARHGVGGSMVTYTYQPDGARTTIAHAGEPCRIATYGDSFTHGDQVNDGETWQEQLAGRIGEPVRNFGIGNYSVYQAYLRLRREEGLHPARCVIFTIYNDDHRRSLDPVMRVGWAPRPSLIVNAERAQWREIANPCPTPRSLYNLCKMDWLTDRYCSNRYLVQAADDWFRLRAERPPRDFPASPATDGEEHSFMPDALYGTLRVLEALEAFAGRAGTKVLYVLVYSSFRLQRYLDGGYRFDESLVRFLEARRLPFVDMLAVHAADFSRFRGTPAEYAQQYFVGGAVTPTGHYSPIGNGFLAAALTPKLVSLVSPKPPAYRILD